jgi:hypothetical protein
VKEENAAFIQWETGQSNCMPLEKKIITGTVFIYQVFKMASNVDYLSSLNTQTLGQVYLVSITSATTNKI